VLFKLDENQCSISIGTGVQIGSESLFKFIGMRMSYLTTVHGSGFQHDRDLSMFANDTRADFFSVLNMYCGIAVEIKTALSQHKPYADELISTYGDSLSFRSKQMISLIHSYQKVQPFAWNSLVELAEHPYDLKHYLHKRK